MTKHLGLDAGSVSVKLAVFDEGGKIAEHSYQRHRGRPLTVALSMLRDIMDRVPAKIDFSLSLTGSAGRLMAEVLGIEPVNEVVAFAFGTRTLYPHIRTIIELGGEDSKLIILGDDSFSAKDFSMNSVCAAGTGSFLDQQAERLRLTIEEFSELSLRSKKPPRIAGRCSVFAKSDMIHLQQIATPVEDIAAGLCFAVARNFKGAIARGRELVPPVSFQGGVAANAGMVRAFREIFGLDELFVPQEFAIMGAIGAALKDMHAGKSNPFDLSKLEEFVASARAAEKGWHPLVGSADGFVDRHLTDRSLNSTQRIRHSTSPIRAYLGVDIGSISTNLAVIDEEGRLLAKRYLMTAGRPIEAVMQGLREVGEEIGEEVEIMGVGTTGSGRYMIADYIGADIVKNEITAQATAAAFIDRDVDTIFEIGGQDSKYISLRDGVIVDFEMNKACAAGTGSFLEEQAEKLAISVKDEFQQTAFSAGNPCRLGERCTVFMENSLMANLQRGTEKEDLLAGLAYSIVQNYINRVVCKRAVGKKIFFQGGVAFNKAVVAAFEKYLGKEIIVPPHHDVTGAIGMALIARDYVRSKASAHLTSFKGFELSQRPYEISSFECKGCSNVCEINRVKVEGEGGFLFYGGRCEKYDVRKKKTSEDLPDLFSFREAALWKAHLEYSEKTGTRDDRARESGRDPSPITRHSSRPRLGIPYIFYIQDYLPFWTTLLWELGFEVTVSPKTDRRIIDVGQEVILSETCFPVKTAHGHIRHLIDEGVAAVLIPSFVNLNAGGDTFESGLSCPYTQTIPYLAKAAFPEAKILTPVINKGRGEKFLEKELGRIFRPFGVSLPMIRKAVAVAEKSQAVFQDEIRTEGERVLSTLKERAVVIVGRSYNSFDRGVNLDIPKKLASLGVTAIPMDFLPLAPANIKEEWPNMYWRSGQKILSAGRLIAADPRLYPIFIGNFSCGPDSFILKFFEKEISGKPFLHLELDSHSADAGAITRCEAFLDSVENNLRSVNAAAPARMESTRPHKKTPNASVGKGRRTVFVPRMSDHAFALAAAFQRCGVDAEVLPEPTKEAVDLGRRYVSGKECYPCAVTTGDMVKKALEPGFRPDAAAFFMPSGTGPCRFGQYNVFHSMVLRDLGFENTPVFAPMQNENFYGDLGIVGKEFVDRSWRGVVAIGLLLKCLQEIRPYEREKGHADEVYGSFLQRAYTSLRGADGALETVLKDARREFGNIPRHKEERPLIGIIGEIFVRSNSFSNEDLVRRIEALGGEAYLTPVEEWIYYVNLMGLNRVLIKREWSGIITLLLKRFFQKRIEHRYERLFEGLLRHLGEPDTKEIIRKASPFLHPSFEGEAILSMGKSVDLISRGASGIVNAMPFGCMPGTIVSGLMRSLKREFGIPCLSIPYDGTESLTTEIQLEAFMDQAREYGKGRNA